MKKNINAAWRFTKDAALVTPEHLPLSVDTWDAVDLPHTWNGIDGQDGGNDYYRATCYYTKTLSRHELPEGEQFYLEFEAANASADVYVNGAHAGHHDGGYSLFRVDITPFVQEENTIVVAVDNSVNDRVYPQNADFTFYGGLYRDVYVIGVPTQHFALLENGTPGLRITPTVQGENAEVEVIAFLEGLTGSETLSVTLLDDGQPVAAATIPASEGKAVLTIEQVHLWHGRKDPHLYTCHAALKDGTTVLDERSIRFGCRTYRIDPEKGFFLNGESYPLRGVCRHQDRPGIGNALKPEHHREDVDMICEVGANTIRLAHYQHNQFFYDLCDERGLVIWAEIPYISRHMPGGRENTFTQMRELITQNYNHPCIVVWGLSNEITMQMSNPDDPDLLDNHVKLNELVHQLDPTRLTVLAAVSMCPITAKCIRIPDVVSYNLYFGWYGGNTSMNGPWMDQFHATHPNIPIGMSEYGCEALDWHTSTPECGDYTEEYQAYYHEELIKQLYTRPYIWATHVWNMFDFGCDARSEGGCEGRNNKGLVTFDRKYKKDSFYAYKAWLSDDPFVHLCGKRYVERAEDVTRVTVYSNQPEVELLANGVSLGKQQSDVHFFYFDVPLAGEVHLTARAGACEDTSRIVRVAEPNMDYMMKESGDVLNWFEIEAPEGYLSIRDRVGVILANPEAKEILMEAMAKRFPGRPMDDGFLKACEQMTLKRMLSMGRSNGGRREMMLELNKRLNACKK
ncbi:MAG: glycoside hydrolase family 2 TIM barrel-domain containing protein [Aristaeellaceae bacterium]